MIEQSLVANIATLKAKLSFFLAQVKQGHEVLVLERKTPIAKVIASSQATDDFEIVKAPKKPNFLKTIKISPLRLKIHSTTLLRADRDAR